MDPTALLPGAIAAQMQIGNQSRFALSLKRPGLPLLTWDTVQTPEHDLLGSLSSARFGRPRRATRQLAGLLASREQTTPEALGAQSCSISPAPLVPAHVRVRSAASGVSDTLGVHLAWSAARQAPRSMGFSRREHCSGSPCLPQGIFPTQGSNSSAALQADS